MKERICLRLELLFLRVAMYCLMGRNVQRSQWVSRRDNNDMWYMGERLKAIHRRMATEYKGEG